jgi:hypothetical protein
VWLAVRCPVYSVYGRQLSLNVGRLLQRLPPADRTALFDMGHWASTCPALYVACRLKLDAAHRAEDFGLRRWPSVAGVALTRTIRSAASCRRRLRCVARSVVG